MISKLVHSDSKRLHFSKKARFHCLQAICLDKSCESKRTELKNHTDAFLSLTMDRVR